MREMTRSVHPVEAAHDEFKPVVRHAPWSPPIG
jgi:hypothetical protein